MKRKILIIAVLLAAISSISAQDSRHRGIALGVDRDTLLFIIASPFDNWWLNVAGDVRTYIGNTPDPQAQWNTLNLGCGFEVGKWIIPDVALSMRFNAFHVNSQSRHGGNNPWTDVSSPFNYVGAEEGPYYPMSVHALSAVGIVTFDWTNFLNGYEAGKRKRLHFFTPVGLGVTWLYGKTINQNFVDRTQQTAKPVAMGDVVWNKELVFSSRLMLEYIASPHVSVNLAAGAEFGRGSLDDHNYSLHTGVRRADWMPSVAVGVKFNLFKTITKYNPHTKTSYKAKVNHEFLSFGTRNTVSDLRSEIVKLNSQIDSIEDRSRELSAADMAVLADMSNRLDDLQRQLDSAIDAGGRMPTNVLADLIAANEVLNLPATIVYYKLDKYDLDYNARKRLENFSRSLKELSDTLEYFIIGAADSATGSIPHNQWLSERRCEAAYNMLVDNFGVNGSQLISVPVGGITEYEPQENNRMAMVILRTKETEDIINRWLRKKN